MTPLTGAPATRGARRDRVPPTGDEFPRHQPTHAVANEHQRLIRGQFQPVLRQVGGAAVYALVVGIAKLPDRETGLRQGGRQVIPNIAGLVQAVNQQDRRGLGHVHRVTPMKAVPAVIRRHGGGKPGMKLLADQAAQVAIGAGITPGPPGPTQR